MKRLKSDSPLQSGLVSTLETSLETLGSLETLEKDKNKEKSSAGESLEHELLIKTLREQVEKSRKSTKSTPVLQSNKKSKTSPSKSKKSKANKNPQEPQEEGELIEEETETRLQPLQGEKKEKSVKQRKEEYGKPLVKIPSKFEPSSSSSMVVNGGKSDYNSTDVNSFVNYNSFPSGIPFGRPSLPFRPQGPMFMNVDPTIIAKAQMLAAYAQQQQQERQFHPSHYHHPQVYPPPMNYDGMNGGMMGGYPMRPFNYGSNMPMFFNPFMHPTMPNNKDPSRK